MSWQRFLAPNREPLPRGKRSISYEPYSTAGPLPGAARKTDLDREQEIIPILRASSKEYALLTSSCIAGLWQRRRLTGRALWASHFEYLIDQHWSYLTSLTEAGNGCGLILLAERSWVIRHSRVQHLTLLDRRRRLGHRNGNWDRPDVNRRVESVGNILQKNTMSVITFTL